MLNGLPGNLFEYCDDRYRDIGQHEYRESKHIKYLAEAAEVDFFPFGYGRDSPDDEQGFICASYHVDNKPCKLGGEAFVDNYQSAQNDIADDGDHRKHSCRHDGHTHIEASEIAFKHTFEKATTVLTKHLIIAL